MAGLIDGMVVSKFRVPAFIITMAMMNVCNGIAYVYSGGQSTRITDKFFIAIGTGYLFNIIPLPVVYMIILIIVFSFLLSKTKFGTYVYAIGGNREAARLSGVPIKKVEIIVFTLSGALAAFAGLVLASRMYSGQPSVGSGYEMDAIAACVLGGTSMAGGRGRISGTVFGAMVIGIISNGLNLIGVSSYWQLIVKGLIIACAVVLDSQKGNLALLRKRNDSKSTFRKARREEWTFSEKCHLRIRPVTRFRFIMKVNIIFFTDIPARNHGISGETAYYMEPLCFGGSGALGGAADSPVSGRGR